MSKPRELTDDDFAPMRGVSDYVKKPGKLPEEQPNPPLADSEVDKPTIKTDITEQIAKGIKEYRPEGKPIEEIAEAIIAKCLEHLPSKRYYRGSSAPIGTHLAGRNEVLDQITSEWSKETKRREQ